MPLREWVAGELARHGLHVGAEQVLVTTGSQQGLDLVAKALIDEGQHGAVESPTYPARCRRSRRWSRASPRSTAPTRGRASTPCTPRRRAAALTRASSTCCPTGRTRPGAASAGPPPALVRRAARSGCRWSRTTGTANSGSTRPLPPLAGRHPDGVIYLGSFSKVLAPGLRLGYVVAPRAIAAKLLQAGGRPAHPGFNQRVVHEVIRNGFIDRHVPTIRALYRAQRDAMLAALYRHMPPGVRWNQPAGGMFLWSSCPRASTPPSCCRRPSRARCRIVPGAPVLRRRGAP